MFHKTLLSFKDLNKIPKLGKQIKTRQLRSIFHHLLLLSKIVQLFLAPVLLEQAWGSAAGAQGSISKC